MIIEPYGYPIENRLLPKIDLMIERCGGKVKRDAVLLIEGAEGEGKTTCSIGIAYYVAKKLNRNFSQKNVFFDVTKMIEFLQSTSDQIAIWDEPALQALSTDFASTVVKDMTRLLMMVRKKRHFIIINMTHFNKFNDYIVCSRPLGMIHVYSRKGVTAGRFLYIRKRYLEHLWLDWRFKKQRNYTKYAMKSGKIMGSFPDILNPEYKNNILDVFDNDAYELEKDKAIMQVGRTVKKDKSLEQYHSFKKMIGNLKFPIKSQRDMATLLGVSPKTIRDWREYGGVSSELVGAGAINNSNGVAVKKLFLNNESTLYNEEPESTLPFEDKYVENTDAFDELGDEE